jgi:hypothetical protein
MRLHLCFTSDHIPSNQLKWIWVCRPIDPKSESHTLLVRLYIQSPPPTFHALPAGSYRVSFQEEHDVRLLRAIAHSSSSLYSSRLLTGLWRRQKSLFVLRSPDCIVLHSQHRRFLTRKTYLARGTTWVLPLQ